MACRALSRFTLLPRPFVARCLAALLVLLLPPLPPDFPALPAVSSSSTPARESSVGSGFDFFFCFCWGAKPGTMGDGLWRAA